MNLNSPIGWCNCTWNPVTGCKNDCPFCYARKLAEGRLKGRFGYENGFEPTFHEDRLREPYHRKIPTKIFVCSMGDIFGGWVKEWWVSSIMKVVYDNPQHTFQFLTKYPDNVTSFMEFAHVPVLPSNMWIGTSVTNIDDLWRIDHLRELVGGKRFVSFEPLLGHIGTLDFRGIDWIIIGAETGNRPGKVAPEYTWIRDILADAVDLSVPIYLKDNLRPHTPHQYKLLKEFPEV